ncbi:SCO7613 C-terminal domain-containing membrane protein [Leifsonia aquatica]|uniref:SCO7613 C-terminal domain-containing membrane protein n=1 Tax=Leifsonia aquatica TaxID=144185 RepID=UPI00384EEC6B
MTETPFGDTATTPLWPPTATDLTDFTKCPACFAPLALTSCAVCGLDLATPSAEHVRMASFEANAIMQKRADLIARIRVENVQARRARDEQQALVAERARQAQQASVTESLPSRPPTAPAIPPTVPTPEPPPAHGFPWPLSDAELTAEADATPTRRHSSVQIALLIVGVSLVGVAAIFFLTVAWIVAGLVFRSVVVAAVTISVLGVATFLRRRGLTSTAEGLGALGVVLVGLDILAVRANDVFGAGQPDALLYWGVAIMASAGMLLGWFALSRIRAASVVALPALPVGLGLATAGLLDSIGVLHPSGDGVFWGAIAALIGTLIHRATWRTEGLAIERSSLLVAALLAALTALIAVPFTAPGPAWAPAWLLGTLALALALHAAAVIGWPGSATVAMAAGRTAGAVAGTALASATVLVAFRLGDTGFWIVAPTIAAAAIVGAFDASGRRFAAEAIRVAAPAAAFAAAVVGGLSALLPSVEALHPLIRMLTEQPDWWKDLPVRPATISERSVLGLIALVVAALLVGASWWLGRVAAARRIAFAATLSGLAMVAIPFAGERTVIVILYLVLGVLALCALLRADTVAPRFRVLALTVGATSLVLGWLTAVASPALWLVASLVLVAALLSIGRLRVHRDPSHDRRLAFSLAAAMAVVVGSAQLPIAFTRSSPPADLWDLVAASTICGCAVGSLIVALPRPGLMRRERVGLFLMFAAPAAGAISLHALGMASWVSSRSSTVALAGEVVALLAVGLWVLHPRNAEPPLPRRIAAFAFAPLLWALVGSALSLIGVASSGTAIFLVPALVATGVASVSTIVAILWPQAGLRGELEAGAVLTASCALLGALTGARLGTQHGPEPLSSVLFVLAAGALVSAIERDGLFASRSWRRHLGWLALALATAGLWTQLAVSGAAAPEPYVLPVSAALLVIAGLIRLTDRRRLAALPDATARTGPAALLVLGGLLVAAVPLALAGPTTAEYRPVVIGVAGAVLAVGSALPRRRSPGVRVLDACVGAGIVAILLVATERGFARVLTASAELTPADAWPLGAIAVAVCASFLMLRSSAADQEGISLSAPRWYGTCASTTVIIAATLYALLEVAVALLGGAGVRTIVAVIALSGLFVAGVRIGRAPLSARVALSSLGLAMATATAGIVVGPPYPIEWMSASLGLAFLAAAILAPPSTAMRSWPVRTFWALGLVTGLLPSAVLGATGSPVRTIVVLAVGFAVVSVTLVWRPSLLRLPKGVELVSIFGGGGVIVVAALARVIGSTRPDAQSTVAFDVWLIVGATILVAAGAAAQRPRGPLSAAAQRMALFLVPAGFALIALPELFVVTDEPALRAILLVTLGCATAIGSAVALTVQRWRTVAIVQLGLALVTAVIAAGIRAADETDGAFEAWLLPVAATLVVVASVLSSCAERIGAWTERAAAALLATALIGTTVAELSMILFGELSTLRAILTVWVLAAVSVTGFWLRRPPLTPVSGWIAFGGASAVTLLALVQSRVDAVELLSVPLAAALIIAGALRLDRSEQVRSWSALGPGILVLLLPSLLADLTGSPLWRVTGLGILALLTVLVGLRCKLQAPFVIGSVVLLVHGVAQLWPWISAAYGAVPWWLWLGAGGVILIAVAARYEKRINDVRTIALSILALR